MFAQACVHGDHALAATGIDGAGYALGLGIAHHGGNGGGVHEDLAGESDAALAAGEKTLAEDTAKALRDHGANLGLLAGGEHVEDAVECRGGVAGVHGADDQVTGLGGGDGHLDGGQVAELTDDDDIGIFAQGGAQGAAEGGRVLADLTLGDIAPKAGMEEFEGVFDGDDVIVTRSVELVDEGVERGRFSRADGAGDEDEAVVIAQQLLEDRDVFEPQFGRRKDVFGDDAVGAFATLLVVHEVDADAAATVHGQSVVVVLMTGEQVFLFGRQKAGVELMGVGGGERGGVEKFKGPHIEDLRRCTGGEVEIARTVILGGFVQLEHKGLGLFIGQPCER